MIRKPLGGCWNAVVLKNHLTRRTKSGSMFPVDSDTEPKPRAIEHGLKTGWLAVYDGMEDAYVMRRG